MPKKTDSKGIAGHSTMDGNNYFKFEPLRPVDSASVRARGVGQQMADGCFYFCPSPKRKSQSRTLVKLPHGKLSLTGNDDYLLTLRIPKEENTNPLKTLLQEAVDALK